MPIQTVTYFQIACDFPGCTVHTDPHPTRQKAWIQFWAADGMEFLNHHPKPYRCKNHLHHCVDGWFHPIPAALCPRCRTENTAAPTMTGPAQY